MLNLLVLLNKYDVKEFEDYLAPLIEPMTKPDSLKTNLNEQFSASDVLRIAKRVNRSSIAESARSVMLEQLWGKEALVSPYETLLFGEELDDKAIIGASYYQILLRGEEDWSTPNLTDNHRRNLTAGRLRCANEWQKIFESIAGTENHPLIRREDWTDPTHYHSSSQGSMRIAGLWRKMGQMKSPWFDLVGRIGMLPQTSYYGQDTRFSTELEKIKNNVYIYFEPEQIDAGL